MEPSLVTHAFIACLASAANYISITDPSKGRMPDASKEKPVDRIWESREKYPLYSKVLFALRNISPYMTLSQAGYSIYLAFHSKKVNFSIKQASMFFLISIVGVSWRYWCFRTLDRYFTFRIQVQDGQKIIKTGPYCYLAHPSYLGQMLNAIRITAATYGPLNIWMNALATTKIASINIVKPLHHLFGNTVIAVSPRLLGQAFACFVGAAYLRHYLWLTSIRIPDEEAMLRKQFGQEYDEFLSQRWKVVPFIY